MKLFKVTTTRKKGTKRMTDYINATCELDAVRLVNTVYPFRVVTVNVELISS